MRGYIMTWEESNPDPVMRPLDMETHAKPKASASTELTTDLVSSSDILLLLKEGVQPGCRFVNFCSNIFGLSHEIAVLLQG